MAEHAKYTVKRVFIASPGDLLEERSLFPRILEQVNVKVAHGRGVHLEAVGCEDTLPGIGRPQAKINEDVAASDLFVMLLWKRWGTPTGAFSSGTEEEFEVARTHKEKAGRPEDIWLYLRKVPDAMLADPGEQLTKVLEFRKRLERERYCLYCSYDSEQDWAEKLCTAPGHLDTALRYAAASRGH